MGDSYTTDSKPNSRKKEKKKTVCTPCLCCLNHLK